MKRYPGFGTVAPRSWRDHLEFARQCLPQDAPALRVGHASLAFESEGLRVVVAGDAAMTRDFFRHHDYYFNTVDPQAAVRAIAIVAGEADVVVPGHDNSFLNRHSP